MPTVADQIHEYLAPEQPDDCRQANLEILARALESTGPVVHRRQVASLATTKGDKLKIHFEDRPYDKVQDPPALDDNGEPLGTPPPREPTDEELAAAWGLPAACATNLPAKATRPARGH